jgi:bifunctional DNase/RNase
MVEVTIDDVVVRTLKNDWSSSPGRHQTVLLRALADGRLLPIHFGPGLATGDILTLQMVERTPSSALTYDLLARLLAAAQVTVERVTLSRTDSGVYYATVAVRVGQEQHVVDAGPGDALNLALRCQAPIFVSDNLLNEKGVDPNQISDQLEADCQRNQPPGASVDTQHIAWRSIVHPPWGTPTPDDNTLSLLSSHSPDTER